MQRSIFLLTVLALIAGLFNGCATTAPTTTEATLPIPTATQPAPTQTSAPANNESASYKDRLGVDLGGILDDAILVDIGRGDRPWETLDGSGPAPVDADGWPTSDARQVFFDLRPFGAWWGTDQSKCPECQDGDYLLDVSGVYKLAFKGQAELTLGEGGDAVIQNQVYDETTNTTSAEIVVGHEKVSDNLLIVQFNNTKRKPSDTAGTGITDVHLLRPGYEPGTKEVFTPLLREAVKPFRVLRFMNWVGGNNLNPEYNPDDIAASTLDWEERNTVGSRVNTGEGVPWEYVIQFANETEKDIWINVPVHATDDYVRGLANLLHDTLRPESRIYVEISNEVWNEGFSQQKWNQAAAADEVKQGNSNLNSGGALEFAWGERRHLRRLIEVSNLFKEVYGAGAINNQIRPVYSWFFLFPNQYDETLAWASNLYGEPRQYLYAIAAAPYFNLGQSVSETTSLEQVFTLLKEGSDNNNPQKKKFNEVAEKWGLKFCLYEAGPDTAGPLQWGRSTQLLETLIAAHRDPRMKEAVLHDLRDNWFQNPDLPTADLYMYFTIHSPYSRWGMWGLTEDLSKLDTPKFQAIREISQ